MAPRHRGQEKPAAFRGDRAWSPRGDHGKAGEEMKYLSRAAIASTNEGCKKLASALEANSCDEDRLNIRLFTQFFIASD